MFATENSFNYPGPANLSGCGLRIHNLDEDTCKGGHYFSGLVDVGNRL